MTDFTAKDIAQLGTILGVWAHPDDETFSMAGVMMAAIANGQRVACVTATRGEKGSQDPERWPIETLGKVREQEMAKTLEIIGCSGHHWLSYIDGELPDVDTDEAVSKIADIIREVQPDTIITFGPDGMTGHDDHKTVGKWAELAVKSTGSHATIYWPVNSVEWYESVGREMDKKFNMFFNIDEPLLLPEAEMDILFRLPNDICRRKTNALRAQESQTATMFAQTSAADMHATMCTEGFMVSHQSL